MRISSTQYGEFEGYGPITPDSPLPPDLLGAQPLMQTFRTTDIKYTYSPAHDPIGTVAAVEAFTVI